MMSIRGLAVVAVGFVALGAVGGAAAKSAPPRFELMPERAFQGKPTSITVLAPAGVHCTLAVRYAGGAKQDGLATTTAAIGRAQWTWSLPLTAPVGPAVASVSCGGSARISQRFTVVGGTVLPSKLQVVAQGFSQRPDAFGGGSTLSYGVQLRDPNAAKDAQSVTVLVNFLDGSGSVLQTATSTVGQIAASSTFNLGASAHLPVQTSVARLEIVVQTTAWVPHTLHKPALENVHIVPSQFEPSWVGSVDGDLINDHPTSTLTNAQVSVVLFDAGGNVIGGGNGYVFASLPPGTRAFFSASSGVSAVATARAASAEISIVPTYKAAGA
jgi:hypothetical protein